MYNNKKPFSPHIRLKSKAKLLMIRRLSIVNDMVYVIFLVGDGTEGEGQVNLLSKADFKREVILAFGVK